MQTRPDASRTRHSSRFLARHCFGLLVSRHGILPAGCSCDRSGYVEPIELHCRIEPFHLFGYSTQLRWKPLDRATSLRVQLNIRNLLDNDDIQLIRLNRVEDGYWRVVAREPRSFRLTVALGF